jgi:hypothetical protein
MKSCPSRCRSVNVAKTRWTQEVAGVVEGEGFAETDAAGFDPTGTGTVGGT